MIDFQDRFRRFTENGSRLPDANSDTIAGIGALAVICGVLCGALGFGVGLVFLTFPPAFGLGLIGTVLGFVAAIVISIYFLPPPQDPQ